MKKLRLVCALLLVLSAVCGCQESLGPADTVGQFLDRFARQDFERMYSLLAAHSKKEIPLNDFCDRYETIYDAMRAGSVACAAGESVETDENHRSVSFTLSVESDRLGSVEFAMTLNLVRESGRWGVDWSTELILPGLEEGDTVRMITLPASRGEIFDSSGHLLAANDYAPTVYVNPDKVDDAEALVRTLAPLLVMTEATLRAKMPELFKETESAGEESETNSEASDSRLVILKAYTREEMTPDLTASLLELPGVGIESNAFTPIRTYPYGQLLSHLLGYTGPVTAEELAADPDRVIPTDGLIGKAGLEKSYNDELTGTPGWELVLVDGNGNRKQSLARRDARNGQDLRLTIDIGLQQEAEVQLMENLTSDMAGTVVVLDPDTGFIQAIASYPTFDPNAFTLGISDQLWAQYTDAQNNLPLFDRATQGLYPPGSTFKPFTAAIALMSGAISADYVFQGDIERNLWTPDLDDWVYPPIKRYSATPSPLGLRNAMIHSDNIFFADIAMKTGADTFYSYCQRFGMDRAIPSDVRVAAPSISNSGELVTIKDLADSGYGQGELLITPVQMASLFASLSNGGTVYAPLAVASVCQTQGSQYVTVRETQPTAWIENMADPSALDVIDPLLALVVSQGTARSICVQGLDVHGKTGTAEIGDDKTREIAWIVGYTGESCESTGTRRLVCVTLEIPAGEGDFRGSIAKALLIK